MERVDEESAIQSLDRYRYRELSECGGGKRSSGAACTSTLRAGKQLKGRHFLFDGDIERRGPGESVVGAAGCKYTGAIVRRFCSQPDDGKVWCNLVRAKRQ